MPLQVLAGPGCDAVGKDDYLEDELEDDDVVISVGRIYEGADGLDRSVPSRSNPPVLRLALGSAVGGDSHRRAKKSCLDSC